VRVDDAVLNDEGSAIDAIAETRQAVMRAIASRKKLRTLEVLGNVENSTITVTFKRDIDAVYAALGAGSVVFSSTVSHRRLNFPMGVQAKRVQIQFQNNVADQDLGLEAAAIGYELVPSVSGR